jgi:hypothetical protein
MYGDNDDDLILGGGEDNAYGGAGADELKAGDIWGGSGKDSFDFRGAHQGIYGDPTYTYARTIVHDFQAGEHISTAGAMRLAQGSAYYGYNATLVAIKTGDISFTRSGGDLVLSTPDRPNEHGDMAHSSMSLENFFTHGYSSVIVNGISHNVSGL